MNHLIYTSTLVFLIVTMSCTNNDKTIVSPSIKHKDVIDTTNTHAQLENTLNKTINVKSFKGRWFEIEYPENFYAMPTTPIDTSDTYSFIETDEAFFSSPNANVTFFVYSPQWSGNPKWYLDMQENENKVSEKITIDDIDSSRIHKWITYKNKTAGYTRAIYSKKSESTHLVFGIQYNNQASYNQFKHEYKAFKASLIQYAD